MDAARKVFSRAGYEAARTHEIAREAGISEALMYRHFPSKRSLHTAVLRQTIREQNESYSLIGLQDMTPAGLIRNLYMYFTIAAGNGHERMKEGFQLVLSSVAGDMSFASQIYRRAQRIQVARVRSVLLQAQEQGEIEGELLDVDNTSMFIEHIGTMMNALSRIDARNSPYRGGTINVVEDALRFATRGLGFTDAAINRHLADIKAADSPVIDLAS